MDGIDESIVKKARDLGPVIREHSAQAERERRLPKPVIDALNHAGLTRAFLPRKLGGLELDPLTYLRVVEELAAHDSAVGWLMMVANGGCWFAGRLPARTAQEMFRDPDDCIVATAFQPPMAATPVDGGFRLDGQRPFASFIRSSRWVCVTGMVMDGDRPRMIGPVPQMIVAITPTASVAVADTWYGIGLRSTDSNDVAMKDVFVPRDFTCPLSPVFEANEYYLGPLYRMPVVAAIVGSSIAPTALAIARRAIDEARALYARKVPMGSTVTLRDRGAAQAALGRAEAKLRSARAFLYETMAECWRRALAGEGPDGELRMATLLSATHAAQTSAEVVDSMFAVGGSSSVFDDQPLQRCMRDALVIRQHGFVAANRYETCAQMLLGLEPDLPLVHF
jgi:alkylation response protein AidB-like acyl-CoA dehydrogenase